jgi:TfoX/Sxy family transcriptional regulator of competence genes
MSPAPRFPRPDVEAKAYFESLLPADPRLSVRPMFGNIAAFVNGQMCTGLFGNAVFVRLDDDSRTELLREDGAAVFEPMKGRPMKEYVQLPARWRDTPARGRSWVKRSLAWVATLPPKQKSGAAKPPGTRKDRRR